MKKLLALLLILVVATGVMFAEDEGYAGNSASATLTLNSSVESKTNHGFYGGTTPLGSFADIFSDSNIGDNVVQSLVMDDIEVKDTHQPVGYYSFATNSPIAFTVSLGASPMELKAEEGVVFVDSDNKVNYLFTADLINGYGVTLPEAVSISLFAGGSSVDIVSSSSEFSGSTTRWGTYKLQVLFDVDGNIARGLPAGDYVGTITASITAN